MNRLQRFIKLCYDKTYSYVEVNVARIHLYCHKNRAIENIPPSQATLLQLVKRGTYQRGFVWGNLFALNPDIHDPSEWDWTRNEEQDWEPLCLHNKNQRKCYYGKENDTKDHR